MFALPISVPFLKLLFFIKIVLKLSYFWKKMKNFRALGASVSGGFSLQRLGPNFRGLGLRPQTSKSALPLPIVDFWLRACV